MRSLSSQWDATIGSGYKIFFGGRGGQKIEKHTYMHILGVFDKFNDGAIEIHGSSGSDVGKISSLYFVLC